MYNLRSLPKGVLRSQMSRWQKRKKVIDWKKWIEYSASSVAGKGRGSWSLKTE